MMASTGSAGITRPIANVTAVSPMKVNASVRIVLPTVQNQDGSARVFPRAAGVVVCSVKSRAYFVTPR